MKHNLVGCTFKQEIIPKGEYVYTQHDDPHCFYYIKDGLIALHRLLLNGKDIIMRVSHAEQFFGYRSLLSTQNYHVSAKALTDVSLTKIYISDADNFFRNNIDFIQYLFSEMANELRQSEIRLSKMSSHNVKLRVIDSIIDLVTCDPNYNWAYREIAAHCGCSTETVIRVSKKLKTSRLMEGKNIHKSYDLEKLYATRMKLASGI